MQKLRRDTIGGTCEYLPRWKEIAFKKIIVHIANS
jgi:hypothetical protein